MTYEVGGRVGVNGTLGTNRECELDLPILISYEYIPSPPFRGFRYRPARKQYGTKTQCFYAILFLSPKSAPEGTYQPPRDETIADKIGP